MADRKIEALKFNGETIYVEVAEVEQEGPDIISPADDDDYEDTDAQSKIVDAGERVRETINALAMTVKQALDKADPSEWSLEVTLGFKGKAGIPFVTEGEANGAVKVTAKWKRS
jgi:hypothetical protein